MLQPGTPVDRYVIQATLGRGGMATVYRVKHAVLGTQHALKVLHQDSRDVAERLILEGQLQAKLDPRVVVPVTDILTVQESPALLMPLIRGCSLRDLLYDYQPNAYESAKLLLRIAEGLHSAHAHGVTHRDLKPGNVLLEIKHGLLVTRVADFGIAHLKSTSLNTDATGLFGTIAYASPEQLEDPTTVDARADLWSLGVIGYELLCGERPFRAEDPGALLLRVFQGNADLKPVPSPWRDLISELLTRDVEARIQSAREVIERLHAHLDQSPESDAGILDALRRRETNPVVQENTRSTNSTLVPTADDTVLLDSTRRVHTNQLPGAKDVFVGRDLELQRLDAAVQKQARLITMHGIGGTGKTRLALEYARTHQAEWPGGAWFCDLSETRTEAGVLSALSRDLGLPLSKTQLAENLGYSLAGRGQTLVVIDNVEQVLQFIRTILSTWMDLAPHAVFIITSRTLVELTGEHTFPVPPLSNATARELFIARAAQSKPGFAPSTETVQIIDALVERLDYLPLAIELAAARIRMVSPKKMLARIGQRFRLLSSGGGKMERHRTLRTAIDWSWNLLADWEQSALAQCAVFDGGFDLDAAEAILDLSLFEGAPWAMDAIQSLVDKSLIRPVKDDRFGLLSTVQEYAHEKLLLTKDAPNVEERHWRHYASFGTLEAINALSRHGGIELRHQLHGELDNIVTAWRRAHRQGDINASTCLAVAASEVLRMSGPLHSAIDICEQTLAMPSISGEPKARALRTYAASLYMQGQNAQSRAACEEALRMYEATDNQAIVGELLGDMGILELRMGNIDDARRYYLKSIAIGESQGNHPNLGGVRGNLAVLYLRTGETERAAAEFNAAMKIHQKVGNRRSEGIIRGNLGALLIQGGDHATARKHYQAAVQIHRECRNLRAECIVLFNIANLDYMDGDLVQAEQWIKIVYRKVKAAFPNLLVPVLSHRAKIHARNGNVEAALRDIDRAETQSKERDHKVPVAVTYAKKATVLALCGSLEEAEEALRVAVQLHDELGGREPTLLREIGEANSVIGMA